VGMWGRWDGSIPLDAEDCVMRGHAGRRCELES
jgi:hypothetical protein